jgi:hypothetical protein
MLCHRKAGTQSRSIDDLPLQRNISRLSALTEVDHLDLLRCQVGEAYVGMFATGTAEVSQPVEALLAVAAYPEDSVAFMSFEFWHRLSTVLMRAGSRATEGNGGGGNGGGAAEVSAAEATRRRQFFQPAFVRLIQVGAGRDHTCIRHVSSMREAREGAWVYEIGWIARVSGQRKHSARAGGGTWLSLAEPGTSPAAARRQLHL